MRSRAALISFALFVLFFFLYGSMSAPGLDWGDAAEAQLAAWTAGLSHPTGYPLFLMVGWLWTHLLSLVGIPPTRAMTLFSVTAGAAAVACFVPMMRALLRRATHPISDTWSLVISVGAALVFGFSQTFWSQALLAEVYTLHALLLVLLLWSLWDGKSGPRRLPWVALVLGLALSHHRSTILWLPGLALWLWLERRAFVPSGVLAPRRLLTLAALVLLPQFAYLYIAWRGPLTPYLHQPLGDGQTLNLYDGSLRAFLTHVSGSVFAADVRLEQPLRERLNMVLDLGTRNLAALVPAFFLSLGSLFTLRRSDLFLLFGGALATLLFGAFYAIGDVEVQFIPAWLALIILAASGLARLLPNLQSGALPQAWLRRWAAITLLLLAVGWQVRHAPPSRASLTAPRDSVNAILNTNPPSNAILITNDRDEMVPFWYVQFAEGQRQDVLGLLPLITPAPEHQTVQSLVGWALQWNRPVLLTKPMPGLSVLYDLEPYAGPLVSVRGRASIPATPVAQADLAPELSVIGWEPPASVVAGEPITVSIALQANAPLDRDLTFSLQLFREDGSGVTQQDVGPDPFLPSSAWPTAEPLRLQVPLPIPADLPSGTYDWRLSAYTLENGFTPFGQQITLGGTPLEVQPP